MDDYLWVLKDSERDLLREIEPDRLSELDEEGLLRLHKRVRRARNKHVTNYRRKASRNVAEKGARGSAYPKGGKARMRAEAFEEALSVVSHRLSDVAHEQAEALKAERLALAQSWRSSGPATATTDGAGKARKHKKSSGGLKRDASSLAKGARRQAKRDA